MKEGPVLMAEEYWINTRLSVARYYGTISFRGYTYKLVNKDGVCLKDLSDPRSIHSVAEGKAIPAGEPADLIREDWLPVYRALGRDRLMSLIVRDCSIEEAFEEAGIPFRG